VFIVEGWSELGVWVVEEKMEGGERARYNMLGNFEMEVNSNSGNATQD
jgi:hypothetical protein